MQIDFTLLRLLKRGLKHKYARKVTFIHFPWLLIVWKCPLRTNFRISNHKISQTYLWVWSSHCDPIFQSRFYNPNELKIDRHSRNQDMLFLDYSNENKKNGPNSILSKKQEVSPSIGFQFSGRGLYFSAYIVSSVQIKGAPQA